MSPDETIRTNRAGKHAAAVRDNRHAKATAPTEPIQLAGPKPTARVKFRPSGLSGRRPAIAGFVLQRIESGVFACTHCDRRMAAGDLMYLQSNGATCSCCHCVEAKKG